MVARPRARTVRVVAVASVVRNIERLRLRQCWSVQKFAGQAAFAG